MNRREAIGSLLTAIPALPATARMSRLDAKRGALIVIECTKHLSYEHAMQIQARVTALASEYRWLVLEPGMRVKVLDVADV